MSALPRCAPPLGSTQAGQVAEQQHLQQVQGTGVHVHQASAEPAAHARLTLDDLAAGYRPAEAAPQQRESGLSGLQLLGESVHQAARTATMPAPARLSMGALASRQQPHSTLAQHRSIQLPMAISASLDTAAVPPPEHHCCCPYLPGYPQAIHIRCGEAVTAERVCSPCCSWSSRSHSQDHSA